MKQRKILWITLSLILVASLFLGYFVINPALNKYLVKKVESELMGNFSYSYGSIEANIYNKSVTIKDIAWQFPSNSQSIKHKGSVAQFSVKGIGLLSLIDGLEINELEIIRPDIETQIEVNKLINQKNDSSRLGQFNFYELIQGKLSSLSIKQLTIKNASARWFSPSIKEVWREVKGAELKIEGFLIDSLITSQRNGMFGIEDLKLSFEQAKIFLADSLHTFSMGKSSISYKDSTINVNSFKIEPIIPHKDLVVNFPFEKTAITINVPEIYATGINYQKLFDEQYLAIDSLNIKGLMLGAYKDKNAKFPYFKRPLIPQQLIQSLSKGIFIKSVLLEDASIVYTQVAKRSDLPGNVSFHSLNLTIQNITNDSIRLYQNPLMTWNFETMLYNEAKLTGSIHFDMLSKVHNHTIKGELAPLDLKIANNMLKPLLAYNVRSGKLNKLLFEFNADQEKAQGKLNFLYDDLKIDKLDFDSMKKKGLDNRIFSLVANTLIIKNANPDWLGKEKEGSIYFNRDKTRSIFHYWWNAILSGLKDTSVPSSSKN